MQKLRLEVVSSALRSALSRRSTRRRIVRSAKHFAIIATAVCTFGSVVLVSQPTAVATAKPVPHSTKKLSTPPNYVHHTRVDGHGVRPLICDPGAPSLPAPSANTLAYLAEPSTNEVQVLDESTGALVGTPITVGTAPVGAAYWQPPANSTRDPLVIVTNSGSHSVTIIDAVTQTVVATVSLPSGSGAESVAASPTSPFAIVVDHESGKVSIIDLTTYTDDGEIALSYTSDSLANVAFDSYGDYAYVTDPVTHKIFTLTPTTSSPYFELSSTYTNSSYDPTGIAADYSTSSTDVIAVTSALTSSGKLLTFADDGSLSSPTVEWTYSSNVPGAVTLSPSGWFAYVDLTGTKDVSVVYINGTPTQTSYAPNSSFTGLGAIGLSADGSTLLSADTASDSVQGTYTSTTDADYTVSTDSEVAAIAPAPPVQDAWDAYVSVGNDVDVVNIGTDSVAQSIGVTDAGPLAVSPDGKYVYVATSASTPVIKVIQTSLVSTTTNPVVASITGIQGSEPNTPDLTALAVSPSGDELLVTDSANGSVDDIDLNPADGSSYRTVVARIGLLGSGIDSTLVTPTGGLAFSPDGLFAYVTEQGVSSRSYDGATVLDIASSTTAGYTYAATDEALTEDGTAMTYPNQIAVNPNDEYAYVVGTYSSDSALYQFPIETSGQIGDGSTTVAPVSTGTQGYGVEFSPEDDSAYVTSTGTSGLVSSVSEAYGNEWIAEDGSQVAWTNNVDGLGGDLAVSPDGLYVATISRYDTYCDIGLNSLEMFNAANGEQVGVDVDFGGSVAPSALVIAPQSSPQAVSSSELVGGASNPAESAVTDGMNDEVTSGTPSDAPGASAGVDTATGAYSLSIDSMTIPDIGPSLDMTATYDSLRASTSDFLGYGWDSTYGMTAAQNPHSASTNPCAIVVTQSAGATVTFFPSAAGPYSTCPTSDYDAPGWAQATLTFESDCNGSDSCFVMNVDARTRYFIDQSTGELVKIEDLHGNTVIITWGSHSACSGASSADPCQVTAADGIRTLTFSYPTPGSSTCPSSVASCVVVTDPLGRTLTYALNSHSQLVSITLANSTTSATYAFQYASATNSELANWWDPENEYLNGSSTSYATDVTYTNGKVTQVVGPEMTDAGTSMTSTYSPTTTFAYDDFDSTTGNGTVLIDDPNFSQSPSMYGANQTLDTYSDFQLTSSVQGYGPIGDYDSPLLAPTPSEFATPMRDQYNLMPTEIMDPLAGAQVGPGPTPSNPAAPGDEFDVGVVQNTYDASANLIMSVDEDGAVTTNHYNELNEVTTSVDAIGNTPGESSSVVVAHTTTNSYDTDGDLLTTTSPATEDWMSNPTTSNYYNANGTLCASRTADEVSSYGVLTSCSSSHATTFTYDSSGDQTAWTDPVGDVTENAFDADGDVCATLTPDGYAGGESLTSCPSTAENNETITLERNEFLNPTKVDSPANAAGGTTWTYFNVNNGEIASVSPMGNPSSCNPLTTSTCPYTTYDAYDAMGDEVSSTSQTSAYGMQGPMTTAYFDPDGSEVATVSPEGNSSGSPAGYEQATVYDNLGDTVAQTSAANIGSGSCSVTSTSSPCPSTQVTTYDPLGNATGNVLSSGGESGSSAVTTVDTFNPDSTGANSIEPTPSNGPQTTTDAYDANGNQLESTITAASTTTTGTTTTYEPNGAICWSSPLPWSGSGAPSCDDPPTGSSSQTTVDYYDMSGNLVAVAGPGSNPYATGNSSGCDPLTTMHCSFTTYYAFDEDNRQMTTTQPTDYVGVYPVTTNFYDASGNLVAVTGPAGDPGVCNPLVTLTCTDTTYKTYDAMGRITQISYTDGTPTVTFEYNNDGTPHQMTDGTGTTSYSYDDLGQLTAKTDGAGNTVTYGYDTAGDLICMSYPNTSSDTCSTSGAGTSSPPNGDITYFYDTKGRLSSIATWTGVTLTYAYDCAGNVYWVSTGTTSGTPCTPSSPTPLAAPSSSAAVTTLYGYTNGQESSIATSTDDGSTPLLSFALSYNGDNQLASSTPSTNGTSLATDSYSYTDSNQVAAGPITGSSGSNAYAYTKAGDITANTTTFQSAAYSGNGELCWTLVGASSNSCASAPSGATTYTYDPSGDRVSVDPNAGTEQALNWEEASGRLVCANSDGSSCSASEPSSTTMVYTYDGDGLLATSTYGSESATTFVWDMSPQRLLSNSSQDYVYGEDPTTPILQITLDGSSPVVDLLCQDQIHDTRGIVQLEGGTGTYTGTLVSYVDYDAYGKPISGSGGVAVPGGLTMPVGGYAFSTTASAFGAAFADASGFDSLTHRFLDPSSAQFLSMDPKLEVTDDPYEYSNDDSPNLVDPSGMGWVPNPYNCEGYIDDAHWADSDPSSGIVKVNAAINGCSAKPGWGTLTIQLWKTGAIWDYLQRQTTVSSSSSQPKSLWYCKKPSKGACQMWDNNTSIACLYDKGVDSTFYGKFVWGEIRIDGEYYYSPYSFDSDAEWTADNCWT